MVDPIARLTSLGELWFSRSGWRRTSVIAAVICGYLVFITVALARGGLSPLALNLNFYLIVIAAAALRLPGGLGAATISALIAGPLISYFVRMPGVVPLNGWLMRFGVFELFGLLAGVVSDLWWRQTRTLRAATERLARAEKMSALGEMASGIAHDFNNILTVIMGFGEIALSSEGATAPEARRNIEQVLDAAQRGASLSHQILAYSRRQILSPSLVDLNQVIRDLQGILERVAGEQTTLAVSLDPEISRVTIDYAQLERVIMNLSINARDALEGPGTITFATRNIDLTQHDRERREEMPAGSYVLLTVSDTGVGMSSEVVRRIFDPYFTTKSKGTGLGLSTVYGIVKQSNGYIYAESEEGRGTTFKIFLPVSADTTPERWSRVPPAVKPYRGGRRRLLIVEDDEEILKLFSDALARQGYEVQTASDAREASEVFGEGGDKAELVIADLVLPDQDGFELVRELQTIAPEVKAIFITGYGRKFDPEKGAEPIEASEGSVILQKPLRLQELLAAIRHEFEEDP